MRKREWVVVDDRLPILTYEYSFGPGLANTLAIGVKGGIALVSPPCGASPDVFDVLHTHGPVVAIVASNAFHHLGIKEWHARFPNAVVAAPAQSVARVKKKTGISSIVALGDASTLQGNEGIEFVDMPHWKTGEVLVRVKTANALYWYVTDVVMNMAKLPKNPLARFVFKVSDSGPGLKFNNVAALFMMKEKAAVKSWLAAEIRKAPPTVLIPCHGATIDMNPGGAPLLDIL